GPDAKPAHETLTRALKDTELWVQTHAAYTLLQIDKDNATALEVLQRIAADSQTGTAFLAQLALARTGFQKQDDTVAGLRKGLTHADAKHREIAAFALGELGPAARVALPDLERATRDPYPMVRHEAKGALRALAAATK